MQRPALSSLVPGTCMHTLKLMCYSSSQIFLSFASLSGRQMIADHVQAVTVLHVGRLMPVCRP